MRFSQPICSLQFQIRAFWLLIFSNSIKLGAQRNTQLKNFKFLHLDQEFSAWPAVSPSLMILKKRKEKKLSFLTKFQQLFLDDRFAVW